MRGDDLLKIRRSNRRILHISIGPANRDPMFTPVWYDGGERLSTPPTPEEPVQLSLLDLPPPPPPLCSEMPPPDPKAAQWEAVLDRANAVTMQLRTDPNFDGTALVAVVLDLLDRNPSADEIVETYRQRKGLL
jgi:hypothetical protein